MTIDRVSLRAYSLLAYASFTAVSAYAVGFFANHVTLTTLDGMPRRHGASAAVVDLVLVLVFGLQHSLMARASFKRTWTRVVPREVERSTYVLTASLLLALLMWQWRPIGPSLDHLQGAAGVGLLVLQGFGWLLVIGSTYLVDHAALFGLAWPAERPTRESPVLVERSAYRYVRHPLMTGFLIVFWATPHLTLGHLLLASLLTLYVVIGTRLEERDLSATFGSAYHDYVGRVPAFLPHLNLLRKPAS